MYAGWYGWNGRDLNEQGLSSFYWATLINNNTNAHYLGVTGEILSPQLTGSMLYGYSLRSIKARRYPLSYVLSGYYQWYDGNLNTQEYGNWSSATAKNDNQIYTITMSIVSNGANPQNYHNKVLGSALHSTPARRYPLSYVFSGYYYWGVGNLNYQDSGGNWWSTTASSDSNAYGLSMNSSGLYPQSNANKAYGFALRCVSISILCPSVSAFVYILGQL